MRDELGTRLERALEGKDTGRSPDLQWVLARGGRLRVLRFAAITLSAMAVVGVIAVAGVLLPGDGTSPAPVTDDHLVGPQESLPPRQTGKEVVEEMTEGEKAEVFAFRALTATGLMEPFGKRNFILTRGRSSRTDAGWRIEVAVSDCQPRGGTMTCRGLSGEDGVGNPRTDTVITVALDNGRWTVIDLEGNVLDEERGRIVGYTLRQREEPSHWEFPAVGVSPDAQFVEMWALWVGPYPTTAPGSVCRLQGVNDDQEVVGETRLFYVEAPQRSIDADGWVRGTDLESTSGLRDAVVDCHQYTGRGWEVASEPEVVRNDGVIAGVAAKLVWRGAEGFTASAVCLATLVDEAGEVVWEGSAKIEPFWRPSELRDYPYRWDVLVPYRGEQKDAEVVGDFSCKSI